MTKPKSKVNKKKKVKKADKKSKAVGYDEFGRRLGTQGALIDTKLSKSPKSIKQLADQTKLSKGRITTHVRDLVKRKLIVKDKAGKYRRK